MGKKRIIVACDGTWMDSDNGFARKSWLPWKTGGHLATPTNVTRICRALLPQSQEGTQQIVYYQAGLGSRNDWYSFFLGGYLGDGICENIREAYAFICNNYEDGDEIVIIGFSRGAFTARSIGGMIDQVGLLTKMGLDSFYPIFKDWQNQVNAKYKPEYGTTAWPVTRPKFTDPSYMRKLKDDGLTRPKIPIKAIGVWDTVGVLGVPKIEIFGIKLYEPAHREFSFIDTEVPSNLEYAYQALALDEDRKPYEPTLWESPKSGVQTSLKLLKQTWFPGVHTSVGGGFADTSISNVTIAWMVMQLSHHLAFDPEYILEQKNLNEQFYINHHVPVASWAMGLIQRSDTGLLNEILGKETRTPGDYYAMDPATGKPTKKKLVNTCEFMHPCVWYRIHNHGPGLATSATKPPPSDYKPKALAGWTYRAPNQSLGDVKGNGIVDLAKKWEGYGKWMVTRKDGSTTLIVEEKIEKGTEEMKLLEAWGPEVAAKVLGE